jgi:hypothetical protein
MDKKYTADKCNFQSYMSSSTTITHSTSKWCCLLSIKRISSVKSDGCDRSAEDAYSSAAPDPTSCVSRGLYKPDFHCILSHVPDLDTDFYCGFFHSPDWTCRFWPRNVPFRSPTVDTDFDYWYHIWNGARGGCDWSAGDAHSSAVPDPTFTFVGGLCCPTLEFVIAFWIAIAFYTLLTSLFCIPNEGSSVHTSCPWIELLHL